MSIVLGSSSTGANSANSNGAGTSFAQRLAANFTDTIVRLGIRTAVLDGAITAIHCAVYADNAGGISSAARLSDDKTSGPFVANTGNLYVLGTPVAVTSGTFYWIEFLAIGGAFNYTDFATTGGTERDTSGQTTCPATHAASTASNVNIANVWAESNDGSVVIGKRAFALRGLGPAATKTMGFPRRPRVSVTIIPTPPVTLFVSETVIKVSLQVGFTDTVVTWSADEDCQAWQIRDITGAAGSTIADGTLVASGGAISANVSQNTTITASSLTVGDGTKTLKIFAQDLEGTWTT